MTVCIVPPPDGYEATLRERPEIANETEALEDRRVLLAGVRHPVRGDAVVPPGEGELRELDDGKGRTGLTAAEPAHDVLFRPEEVHRRSGEDDVVPPSRRGHLDVEEERLVVGSAVSQLVGERLAAVGAGRLDPPVLVQRRADPERVPGAVPGRPRRG